MAHKIVEEFEWRRLGYQPRLTQGRMHDCAIRVLRRLDEWGVNCPVGSRLPRIEALLAEREIKGADLRADPDLELLLAEAHRSTFEFYLATHGFEETPSEEYLQKLRIALGGADLPRNEDRHWNRDIQFELYVFGLLRAGGVNAWFDERPDIRFVYGREVLGMAVKRIWSLEQAHGALSEAARQIDNSGLRGVIAANVQEYINGIPDSEDLHVRGGAFNDHIERLHGQFPYLTGKPHVAGLLSCGIGVEWGDDAEGVRRLKMAMVSQMLAIGGDADEAFTNWFYGNLGNSLGRWFEVNL